MTRDEARAIAIEIAARGRDGWMTKVIIAEAEKIEGWLMRPEDRAEPQSTQERLAQLHKEIKESGAVGPADCTATETAEATLKEGAGVYRAWTVYINSNGAIKGGNYDSFKAGYLAGRAPEMISTEAMHKARDVLREFVIRTGKAQPSPYRFEAPFISTQAADDAIMAILRAINGD